MLSCSAIISILLLDCNDNTGLNVNSGDDSNSANMLKNTQPYDPPLLIIADDVGKWLEEQFASKSGEKRPVRISDMYLPNIESEAGLSATRDSDGKIEYFSGDKKISAEEYLSKWEYERQKANYDKRSLSIPGEIIYENSRGWTVSITAEELSELSKKYDKLVIEFYIEPMDE